jgi:hypothetical protein
MAPDANTSSHRAGPRQLVPKLGTDTVSRPQARCHTGTVSELSCALTSVRLC